MIATDQHEIELSALDGSNLLAFLAAVGSVRILATNPDHGHCRLSWRLGVADGIWRPCLMAQGDDAIGVIHKAVSVDISSAVPKIETERAKRALCKKARKVNPAGLSEIASAEIEWFEALDELPHPSAFRLYSQFSCPLARFREQAIKAIREGDRGALEHLASYCSEAIPADEETTSESDFRGLRNMRDDDKPGIISYFRRLSEELTLEHIRQALLCPWNYSDGTEYNLRWDSDGSRSHALSATAPADDKSGVTMRGANRLAVEALPLFPVMPVNRQTVTTGFTCFDDVPEITWPIWTEHLELDSIRTLLALPEFQEKQPNRTALEARGIVQAFRARRFNEGQYRNFSPARALL